MLFCFSLRKIFSAGKEKTRPVAVAVPPSAEGAFWRKIEMESFFFLAFEKKI